MFSSLTNGNMSSFVDITVELLVAVADGTWCWLNFAVYCLYKPVVIGYLVSKSSGEKVQRGVRLLPWCLFT